ncbi:MAG: PQQ-binding-like beta-propeller repeat protein [Bauldia sp.]|nr:PQQ-binding-like beta-propeller repeat protein [Bauldia sp.]
MRRRALVTLLATALPFAAASPTFGQESLLDRYSPVTDALLATPADGDWLSFRRTAAGWGYSPLDQINRDNVGDLNLVWARGMEAGNQEGTPLVHDGVMFLPNAAGVIQALDATNGDLLWEYRRQYPENLADFDGLAGVTRTVALYENLVITTTSDGFIVALDIASGQVVYEIETANYETQSTRQSGGPIIANGKIISGRRCSARGGPAACFVAAHDATNGEELWRFYTIPQPGEPGFDTWGDTPYESRRHLGTWMVPTFDPDLNLVYFGTSTTAPYSKFHLNDPLVRDWEYLYQSSTLAIDADTGELVWYVQHLRDHWDLDNVFTRMIVDTVVSPDPAEVDWINPNLVPGETRQVITGIPGKLGLIYTIDRATGEFLWARDTVYQNVVVGMQDTGLAVTNPDILFTELNQEYLVCAGIYGGLDWQAGTYSPRTNAMYYPLQNACSMQNNIIENPTAADGAAMRHRTVVAPDAQNIGTVFAVSAETGRTLWTHDERAGVWSMFSTGGGLVFGGDLNRRFRAFNDETGEVLWETILGAPMAGYPMTYAVDGRQYVAVPVGAAGVTGRNIIGLTPELRPGASGNYLFVFALPGD